MQTLSRFVAKFTSLIVAVLSCFDRVIFKGHLALATPCELEYFVDRVLKVRRSDFIQDMAPLCSDSPSSTGRESSIVGHGRSIPCCVNCSPGLPAEIWST